MIRVLYEKPPIYEAAIAVFPVENKDVIYAYGDRIYRPFHCGGLSRALLAHEGVHCDRQTRYDGGVEAWWKRYLDDPAFRLDEEVPAHYAELKVLQSKAKSASMVAHYLSVIAARLASPMYGGMVSIAEAKKLLA